MNKYQNNVQLLRPSTSMSRTAIDTKMVQHSISSNKRSYVEAFFQSEDEDEDEDEDKDEDEDEDEDEASKAIRAKSEEALKQFAIMDILDDYQRNRKLTDYFDELLDKCNSIEEMRNDRKKLEDEVKNNNDEIMRLKSEVEDYKVLWLFSLE